MISDARFLNSSLTFRKVFNIATVVGMNEKWAPGQSPFRIFDKYENESFLFSLNGRNAQPHPTTLISLPINRSNGQSDLRSKEGVGSGSTGLFKISLSIACMTGRFRNPIFAPFLDREMGNF